MAKEKALKSDSLKSTKVDTKLTTSDKLAHNTSFPIVGIGASDGGLVAFEAFFSGMPLETDLEMSFILVQNFVVDYKKILLEFIKLYSRMQVIEAEEDMLVQPNCVYITPPNRNIVLENGKLKLLEPSTSIDQRFPIDVFFHSLALEKREYAIGILLSGTDGDGTEGLRAIKKENGLVMAQNSESTEFDCMPCSVLGTGLLDYELPPVEMPSQLIAYAIQELGHHPRPIRSMLASDSAVKKIFHLLHVKTGHDFSQYKPNTIYRRIERRMDKNKFITMNDYIHFLQQTPSEVELLFRDFLIGVTNFFRDPEAFQVLEKEILPNLINNKTAAAIRVWSIGCSTGEEAYSIAILLQEYMDENKQNFTVQIFATDIDGEAITKARAGIYSASIVADIKSERLARFFTHNPENNSYRINKGIRDMLIFSEHDLLRDPPFSKLDLISCRNLLIYLSLDLQKKLIPLFHYSLQQNGILFLGTSEGVGDFSKLFVTLDRKNKIYRRKGKNHPNRHTPPMGFATPAPATSMSFPQVSKTVKIPLRDLTERTILQQIITAGALVNGQGDILYYHGRTGTYLEPAPGKTGGVDNILKMAREGLRTSLSKILQEAVSTNKVARALGQSIKINDHFISVNFSIYPVKSRTNDTIEPSSYFIAMEEAPSFNPQKLESDNSLTSVFSKDPDFDFDTRVIALRDELQVKEEYLQSTYEELENANEELKSTNEEMQSVNEEFQSTIEELETSKEELHSINEELATVNIELSTKVAELSRANDDISNLLAGTGIATIFVDQNMHILNFTPVAAQIINLISSDIGRPLGHIVTNLVGGINLASEVQAMLKILEPKESEVFSTNDKWYTMSIWPYRTLDNLIKGAVINFVDITKIKEAQRLLEENELFLRKSQKIAHIGSFINDLTTHKWTVSPEMYEIFGVDKKDHYTAEDWPVILHPISQKRILEYYSEAEKGGTTFDFEYKITRIKDGVERWVHRLEDLEYDNQYSPVRRIGTIQDITERKQLIIEAQRKANDLLRLAVIVRDSYDAKTVYNLDGLITAWNPAAERLYGWSEAEAMKLNIKDRIPHALQSQLLPKLFSCDTKTPVPIRTQRLTKSGTFLNVWVTTSNLLNEAGQIYAVATTEREDKIEFK